ncbi:MAG: hypothetical protein V2B14_07265 [bacterium]
MPANINSPQKFGRQQYPGFEAPKKDHVLTKTMFAAGTGGLIGGLLHHSAGTNENIRKATEEIFSSRIIGRMRIRENIDAIREKLNTPEIKEMIGKLEAAGKTSRQALKEAKDSVLSSLGLKNQVSNEWLEKSKNTINEKLKGIMDTEVAKKCMKEYKEFMRSGKSYIRPVAYGAAIVAGTYLLYKGIKKLFGKKGQEA